MPNWLHIVFAFFGYIRDPLWVDTDWEDSEPPETVWPEITEPGKLEHRDSP